MKIPATVEVLTLNSGKTLERCLESVKDFDEVLIIDGNSTDDTVSIAKRFGARIVPQSDSTEPNVRIDDFARARNVGLRAATHGWFLFVDSDEYLSRDAVSEIRTIVAENTPPSVYRMPRKYVVDGVVIERSSMYPNYQTRFFHREAVHEFVKPVHERIQLKEGAPVHALTHPTLVPFEGQAAILEKWRRYAQAQVERTDIRAEMLLRHTTLNLWEVMKYAIKYARTFLYGSGPRMPFVYEWHNALYHLRLIGGHWKKYWSL